MDRLDRLVGALARLGLGLAGLAALLCLVLVGAGVVARYGFNASQPWIDELATWLVVAMVMLAVAEAQRRGDHIGVDALVLRFRATGQRRLAFFSSLSVGAVGALMVSAGIDTVSFSRLIGIKAVSIAWVPMWWVHLLLPVGGALLLAVAAVQLLAILTGRWSPPAAADTLHGTRSHE